VVLEHRSLGKLLPDLFPDVKFDELQFASIPSNDYPLSLSPLSSFSLSSFSSRFLLPIKLFCVGNYLQDRENKTAFFLKFASKKGFDHLLPENWYPVKREDVLKEPVNHRGSKRRVGGREKRREGEKRGRRREEGEKRAVLEFVQIRLVCSLAHNSINSIVVSCFTSKERREEGEKEGEKEGKGEKEGRRREIRG
jgi:hypothetical protein